MSRLFMVQCV